MPAQALGYAAKITDLMTIGEFLPHGSFAEYLETMRHVEGTDLFVYYRVGVGKKRGAELT